MDKKMMPRNNSEKNEGKVAIKLVFMGATKFSEAILLHLLQNRFKVTAIFTIPEKFHISYSPKRVKNYQYADLNRVAKRYHLPIYLVNSVLGKRIIDYYEAIEKIKPDLILAIGWYYLVPKRIRNLAKYGAWGVHASLLPKYAGGAPLVWAMIRSEKKTGVTLFRFDDGVDDGDIILQKPFSIRFDDTIKEVYEKAIEASKEILIKALTKIDKIKYQPQIKSEIERYPQRTPKDGEIDLTKSALEIYNFIRAQSPPYPGAFLRIHDGKKLIIEKARIEKD